METKQTKRRQTKSAGPTKSTEENNGVNEGGVSESAKVETDMIEALKQELDALKSKIESKNSSDNTESIKDILMDIKGGEKKLTIDRDKMEKSANKLIRVKVMPADPLKANTKAELFTVSNDALEDMTYSVPFNIETHIPYAIYCLLRDKKAMILDEDAITGDPKTGQTKGGHREIPAYNITILPPLTEEELKSLATKQKLRSDDLDERIAEITGEEDVVKEVDPLKEAGYDI